MALYDWDEATGRAIARPVTSLQPWRDVQLDQPFPDSEEGNLVAGFLRAARGARGTAAVLNLDHLIQNPGYRRRVLEGVKAGIDRGWFDTRGQWLTSLDTFLLDVMVVGTEIVSDPLSFLPGLTAQAIQTYGNAPFRESNPGVDSLLEDLIETGRRRMRPGYASIPDSAVPGDSLLRAEIRAKRHVFEALKAWHGLLKRPSGLAQLIGASLSNPIDAAEELELIRGARKEEEQDLYATLLGDALLVDPDNLGFNLGWWHGRTAFNTLAYSSFEIMMYAQSYVPG